MPVLVLELTVVPRSDLELEREDNILEVTPSPSIVSGLRGGREPSTVELTPSRLSSCASKLSS